MPVDAACQTGGEEEVRNVADRVDGEADEDAGRRRGGRGCGRGGIGERSGCCDGLGNREQRDLDVALQQTALDKELCLFAERLAGVGGAGAAATGDAGRLDACQAEVDHLLVRRGEQQADAEHAAVAHLLYDRLDGLALPLCEEGGRVLGHGVVHLEQVVGAPQTDTRCGGFVLDGTELLLPAALVGVVGTASDRVVHLGPTGSEDVVGDVGVGQAGRLGWEEDVGKLARLGNGAAGDCCGCGDGVLDAVADLAADGEEAEVLARGECLRVVFAVAGAKPGSSDAGDVDGLFLAGDVDALGTDDDGVAREHAPYDCALESGDERCCGRGSRRCSVGGRWSRAGGG